MCHDLKAQYVIDVYVPRSLRAIKNVIELGADCANVSSLPNNGDMEVCSGRMDHWICKKEPYKDTC